MFGIGWSEMLVIVLIAVLVIGPKDIPKIMYQVGRFARRLQYVKFAMSQQFDEVLRAGDIEELRKGVNFEAPKTNEKLADEEHSPLNPPVNGGKSSVDESPPAGGGARGGD